MAKLSPLLLDSFSGYHDTTIYSASDTFTTVMISSLPDISRCSNCKSILFENLIK